MVPLKPNELRREGLRRALSARRYPLWAVFSTGMRKDDRREDTIDDRWAFNLRRVRWPDGV